MKIAYIVVMWDIGDDSETILGVYLSKSAAEAAVTKLEDEDIKYKKKGFSYWVAEAPLVEE